MRITLVTFCLMVGLCSMAAYAQMKPAGEKQPAKFDGAMNTSWKTPDGIVAPLFIDITLSEFQPADPKKAATDEILKSISAEGSDLGKMLGVLTLIYQSQAPEIKGVTAATGYTLVLVHRAKGIVGAGELKNPVTFTPGPLTDLKQVVSKFGEPANKQIWSDELTRQVGLDGIVCWWGEIGIAANESGKITHVLRRQVIKKA